MEKPYAPIARAAAARLAASVDPNLPQLTERVLAEADHPEQQTRQYDVSIALAAAQLIVGIAALAWTVYWTLKKEAKAPSREVLARKVRIEAVERFGGPDGRGQEIIEVVVEELWLREDIADA